MTRLTLVKQTKREISLHWVGYKSSNPCCRRTTYWARNYLVRELLNLGGAAHINGFSGRNPLMDPKYDT